MRQIEIARFADVYEAEIVASRLRADGFTPTLGGAEHAKADPLILQALGWIRLSVPDGQVVEASARLEALRHGAEAIEESSEPESGTVPDRTLPAKVTLGATVLAFVALLAGR
ncbi:hypothetical protein [uncultured Brevundimonas sp.]|uniref:hypothetical protein n=1 Tax=uncultured Brevundimonas sp. TaxID=213418 RepID=UPI0030EE4644|tara:strand:+ start:18538 stop:18876 length:339 start_codon:yes stop_codon:yes gene_type:complete